MKQLNEKLRGQGGASILLALLFLLVCMMVGASVLMAAVSNAGKIRSNYDEQQKYMALSSALRLVAGEIENGKAEYTGKYNIYRWDETFKDSEDHEITLKYYCLTQAKGTFLCGSLGKQPESPGSLDCKLPLLEELDGLFGQKEGAGVLQIVEDPAAPEDHPMLLTIDATAFGGVDKIKKILNKISITARMDENRRIRLTAAYTEPNGDGEAVYSMEASLSAVGAPVVGFALAGDDGDRILGSASQMPDGITPETKESPVKVTWKLDWVARKAPDETGAGG